MRSRGKLASVGMAAMLAVGLSAASAQAGPIRALVVTGGHGFDAKTFFRLFEGYPDITYKHVAHPQAADHFAPDKADAYDVLVLYDMRPKLPDKSRQDFKKLVTGGKGLLVLHHALANYQDWDEYVDIVGGAYAVADRVIKGKKFGRGKYKHDVDVNVRIADKNHPITRGMGDFTIYDEVYKEYYISPKVHPLLTTNHPLSEKLVGWTNTYAGREIVCLQLGHGPEAYANENYRKLVSNSIRFVAGRLSDKAATSDKGFVPLFNGKDLSGWVVVGKPEGWEIRDGILHSDAHKGGYWLRTEKKYSDFILKVEWKVSPRGNSGAFIRANDRGQPWGTGYEIQISNEQPPRDDLHCTGALYGLVAVNPRPDESPNVWHSYEIHAVGKQITVIVDGKKVVDVNQNAVEKIKNKASTGYIGLQDSHGPAGTTIEYRNILIKDLSKR